MINIDTCKAAARKYLAGKGYDVLQVAGNVILAKCEECCVLVAVTTETEDAFPVAQPPARSEYEVAMVKFLTDAALPVNVPIRLDHIAVVPCCDNTRAIIRHHISAI